MMEYNENDAAKKALDEYLKRNPEFKLFVDKDGCCIYAKMVNGTIIILYYDPPNDLIKETDISIDQFNERFKPTVV